MTTAHTVRTDYPPYRPPSLFDDAPSQARPPSAPEPSRRPTLRHYLEIAGEPLAVRVEHHPDRPSWGPLPFRVVKLCRRGEVRARVCNAPEGIVCTCDGFRPDDPCEHVRAMIAADLFPEVSCDLPAIYRREGGGG